MIPLYIQKRRVRAGDVFELPNGRRVVICIRQHRPRSKVCIRFAGKVREYWAARELSRLLRGAVLVEAGL